MIEELKTLDSLPPMPEGFAPPIEEPQVDNPNIESAPEVEKPNIEPDPGQSPSAKHFKAVRDLKERAERERDEAIRRAQEVEARYSNIRTNSAEPLQEESQEITIGNDELAEGKHLKTLLNKISKLEKQQQQYQSQSSSSIIEARLKMQYPDIEKVVSKENVEILGIQYPELAATINESSDLYKKAVSAYTLIKKLGIHPEDNYREDRTRAAVNAAKPRTLSSVNPQQGDSPLSHANAFANGLTDELKASLLKEMMQARR